MVNVDPGVDDSGILSFNGGAPEGIFVVLKHFKRQADVLRHKSIMDRFTLDDVPRSQPL